MFINDKTLGFIGCHLLYSVYIGRPIYLRVNLPQTERNPSVYMVPKCLVQIGAEVSGQFGTSAEVSLRHFGTGAELSGHFGSII